MNWQVRSERGFDPVHKVQAYVGDAFYYHNTGEYFWNLTLVIDEHTRKGLGEGHAKTYREARAACVKAHAEYVASLRQGTETKE